MSKQLMLRIQSPEHGTKRLQITGKEKINDFIEKVCNEFGVSRDGWSVYKQRDKTGEIKGSRNRSLTSCDLKHGDMLYLFPSSGGRVEGDSTPFPEVSSSPVSAANDPDDNRPMLGSDVVEDEVDQLLEKMDGKIYRSKNEQLCQHGSSGKCLHCVPLEPYDEQYLKEADPPIKFLSFHSHIRRMKSGVDKGKFATLENLSCKIKPGCREHPPWPGGICTKCQPSAVTLSRQKFRHVDYIMFENHALVDNFFNYWRSSGNQRIGFLYGKYEHHKDIPLGIRATVAAIYEPPQVSRRDSVELLPDDKEDLVNSIAAQLGLQRVGWIFTDLIAKDLKTGTVKHYRGTVDTHFLSAEECIMAAEFQNKHPNPCKLSPDGHFGSKFVSVVVTGDASAQIHFEGYQVSDQCMALVRDDCFIPTKDAPELGFIKESSNKQYVPDVFYKDKDEYGNEVMQLARPLPVEYLLIDMAAAFPVEQQYTFFYRDGIKPFPIENRAEIGEIQDFNALTSYMHQYTREDFLNAMSDFHLLIFLATCDMLPLKDHMNSLFGAVKNKDEMLAHHWSKTEEWGTVEQLMEANVPSPPPMPSEGSFVGPNADPLPPIRGTGAMWTCAHCTFLNQPGRSACEMCTLPRS